MWKIISIFALEKNKTYYIKYFYVQNKYMRRVATL